MLHVFWCLVCIQSVKSGFSFFYFDTRAFVYAVQWYILHLKRRASTYGIKRILIEREPIPYDSIKKISAFRLNSRYDGSDFTVILHRLWNLVEKVVNQLKNRENTDAKY